MKTINEDSDVYPYDGQTRAGGHSAMSHKYSDGHRSGANILEESVAEAGRGPAHIEGLTDFLTDEYFKRFGIYTSDATELQKFWKNHVSAAYKEMRAQKAQLKNQATFNPGLDDFGLGDLDLPPNGRQTVKNTRGKGSSLRAPLPPPPVKLPDDNF
jgi:hypothetical protein